MSITDPVSGLPPEAPCWCRSGRRHSECHGNTKPPSQPGDPIPIGDEEKVFLSPTTYVDKAVLLRIPPGERVYLPDPDPVQRPLRVPALAEAMARRPKRTTVGLDQLGLQRFVILDGLGLSDLERLERRTAELTDTELEDLRYAFLDIAKCTLDTLLEGVAAPEPATAIWAGTSAPLAMLGATLLWADQYLVNDDVLASLCRDERSQSVARAIRELLAIRPLVEVGLIVPVLHDAATVMAGELAVAQTQVDLGNLELVQWVMDQLVVEGPTATSALLFSAIDDDELAQFFLHARIVHLDDATHSVTTRLLGAFDPSFDYDPWIEQCYRQTTARIIQEANLQLTMADAFGASWVTLSPFKARLLERRPTQTPDPQTLVWADVPHLQRASAVALAKVMADDTAVQALRNRTRQVFAATRTATPEERRAHAIDLGAELGFASEKLRREMDRDRRWKLAAPVGLTVASLAVGAAAGATAVGAVAGLLAAAAGLSPYISDHAKQHENPAYALLLGDGLVEPRPRPGTGRAAELTDIDFPLGMTATE